MQQVTLSAQQLSFSYGEQQVLRDVSFALQGGSFCCLLGRNGAGKSTLLRCLLGLAQGYAGSISVNDRSQLGYSRPELARQLAYIPQSLESIYEYTVEQFVVMGRVAHLGLFCAPSAQDKEIAGQSLALLGIAELAKKSVAAISGGERQLAAIARALTQQSRILIMDEPTASLDYGNQIRFMQLAKRLASEGYLVLMSCHNPHQARQFADQTLVLHQGRIWAQGNAQAVITPEMIATIYELEGEQVYAELDTAGA